MDSWILAIVRPRKNAAVKSRASFPMRKKKRVCSEDGVLGKCALWQEKILEKNVRIGKFLVGSCCWYLEYIANRNASCVLV